jgi:conjugative transfer signal peptidase TraF
VPPLQLAAPMVEPIIAWQPWRRAAHRLRRTCLLAIASLAILAVAHGREDRPLVVDNASASAPLGLYRVLPAEPLHRGDLVFAQTPAAVRRMAAVRGYLPEQVRLVKRIAALAGDRVCARDRVLDINGRFAVRARVADRLGRPLPSWSGCYVLSFSQVLLLMADNASSFDGRYFGPTPRRDVVGRLRRFGAP